MNALLPSAIFLVYTLFIFLISRLTSRKADDDAFYRGNRRSPWYVVAYGMIGASLSGVTFLSEPGWVKDTQFSYMMVVFGYVPGYVIIAFVLLPLYYRLNLTSIYACLENRFGICARRTGASFFILSRAVGSSIRMFLTVYILHLFVFRRWGVSFEPVAFVFAALILLYTFKGGIKTIVWTDALQTTFMLLAVGISVWLTGKEMGWSLPEIFRQVKESEYSGMVVTDWTDRRFYLKQFLSGIFIPIVMTGLDQDMMQKNLSCRTLRDAQKNMLSFGAVLIAVNLLFLTLGAVLVMYAQAGNIETADTDLLFADIAVNRLGGIAGVVFIVGLVAAAYSSADGTLAALTTSFCIDVLRLDKRCPTPRKRTRIRHFVHLSFTLLAFLLMVGLKQMDNRAVIDRFFVVAGYTYGPLLGLYSFGLCTKMQVRDRLVPLIAVASPLLTCLLDHCSEQWLWGYRFGFELLMVNGLITFAGLWLCRKKPDDGSENRPSFGGFRETQTSPSGDMLKWKDHENPFIL
ncbi:MAG: sodium:solute symporter [Bacteroidales bacterium]|jgi:Na+/proline symporter|nr:sodium:solute symporter [Bacteroidales bacterium]